MSREFYSGKAEHYDLLSRPERVKHLLSPQSGRRGEESKTFCVTESWTGLGTGKTSYPVR